MRKPDRVSGFYRVYFGAPVTIRAVRRSFFSIASPRCALVYVKLMAPRARPTVLVVWAG
jgi:hypothetical protein